MEHTRELAMELAVNYCNVHPNDDLIEIAKEIYDFLVFEDGK